MIFCWKGSGSLPPRLRLSFSFMALRGFDRNIFRKSDQIPITSSTQLFEIAECRQIWGLHFHDGVISGGRYIWLACVSTESDQVRLKFTRPLARFTPLVISLFSSQTEAWFRESLCTKFPEGLDDDLKVSHWRWMKITNQNNRPTQLGRTLALLYCAKYSAIGNVPLVTVGMVLSLTDLDALSVWHCASLTACMVAVQLCVCVAPCISNELAAVNRRFLLFRPANIWGSTIIRP